MLTKKLYDQYKLILQSKGLELNVLRNRLKCKEGIDLKSKRGASGTSREGSRSCPESREPRLCSEVPR